MELFYGFGKHGPRYIKDGKIDQVDSYAFLMYMLVDLPKGCLNFIDTSKPWSMPSIPSNFGLNPKLYFETMSFNPQVGGSVTRFEEQTRIDVKKVILKLGQTLDYLLFKKYILPTGFRLILGNERVFMINYENFSSWDGDITCAAKSIFKSHNVPDSTWFTFENRLLASCFRSSSPELEDMIKTYKLHGEVLYNHEEYLKLLNPKNPNFQRIKQAPRLKSGEVSK
jgi:hypothetical protein